MSTKEKVYGVADKAWQVVVGCDPKMSCAPRCWARRTVARIVKCHEPVSPERAQFFQVALSADGRKWSGEVFVDRDHLTDPLSWRAPALVATGFHGDVGRLPKQEMCRVFGVIALCRMFQSTYPSKFMLLTKQPDQLLEHLADDPAELSIDWGTAVSDLLDGEWIWKQGKRHRDRIEAFTAASMGFYPDGENMLEEDAFPIPLDNATIGCSVMNQQEADKMREAMKQIAELGWRTHVWYEPALGPVDWRGWEFIEQLIMGGESGLNARPSDLAWYRNSLRWCRQHNIAPWMKQLGADPSEGNANGNCRDLNCTHPDSGYIKHPMKDRKGESLEWIPADLRVREYPKL